MSQQGQLFQMKRRGRGGEPPWAFRYRLGGRGSKRVQRGGFGSEQDAAEALGRELERLRRERRVSTSLTLAELVEMYLAQHDVEQVTIEKLRWLLGKAVAAFGARPISELRSEELAAWRIELSSGYRFDATQALRQVLARAVVWGMIDVNPAKLGVDNPSPRRREQRPFESWAELDAVAAHLSPRYRPMVIFAAATGLRPAEWLALEWRDIDLEARVVYVHRSFTKGRLKCPKTEASRRAVPLQTIALKAIERQLLRRHSPLVFPAERGGYLDRHNFRNREWKPAQVAAGIEPLRRIYDLRHTFATFALRAGISTFDLSRYMGASLTMIDRHYGHLARRTRARDPPPRRAQRRATSTVDTGGRRVDTEARRRCPSRQRKRPLSRIKVEAL
ncbi:MAG TPA: site-specific integrase [Gaiellaceae bacterium]|nr:site-specific integrase [Gaiellaceae bacterium]